MGLLVFAGLYFIPTWIGLGRRHEKLLSIFLVNLILGFTGFGWMIALLMATDYNGWVQLLMVVLFVSLLAMIGYPAFMRARMTAHGKMTPPSHQD